MTWRAHADPAHSLVGGLRLLIIQALDPLAMAGVAQHSDYRERPLKRLQRTAEFVAVTTFGTAEEAERAAAVVRHVHRKVVGIDPVTGRPYSASDPDTALWIHVAEIHSFLLAHERYSGRLDAADRDRYFAENAVVAELLGVPADAIPRDVAATPPARATPSPTHRCSASARHCACRAPTSCSRALSGTARAPSPWRRARPRELWRLSEGRTYGVVTRRTSA